MKKCFFKRDRSGPTASRAFLLTVTIPLALFMAAGFFSPLQAEVVDRILAVVNDDIVTLFEFKAAIKPYEERIRSLGYPPEKEKQVLSKIREDLLNQLIDEKLAQQEIKRFNLSVSDQEIENNIERFKTANGLTDQGLKKALEEDGISLEAYKERVKDQILRSKLVNRQVKSKIVITQEEIRTYYENHPERYGPRQRFRLRHILVRVSGGMDEKEKAEKQKRMESALGELKKGKPFPETAKKYSEVFAEEEGLLGVIDFDALSKKLQGALKGKVAGEFTEIIETDQGLQIVYIEEIVTMPAKELANVSAEIEETLFQERIKNRYESWLEELKTKSIVKRID